jgi:putative spermidine/putrescine transport system permease protein
MSSSSDEVTPQLDAAELEHAERITEQHPPKAETALGEPRGPKGKSGWLTLAWATPGFGFLGFYLVAPLVFIVLVSFWTYQVGAERGFVTNWTWANYSDLFHDRVYWDNMLTSFETSLIAVAACLIFGFPVAYFLALKVESLRMQIALFLLALTPFWTSYLTRSVAWTYPLMGREGAVNKLLEKIGLPGTPYDWLGFSQTSVTLAMIQLYILFMVTPLFFTLAQVDRTALEAARDLGGNWFRTFREVILPQTLPGIVIGSIFIFVLTMGENATVRVIGGNAVTSVGTIVDSKVVNAVQYPQGAASAVLLLVALIIGVFVITRVSNLREDL